MMKKVLISGLLASVLVQPIFAMEKERKSGNAQNVVRSAQEQRKLNYKLLSAVQKGSISQVKGLLNNGADANAKSNGKWTALHAACANNQLHMVRLLLACKDIQINAEDKDGRTPLWWACSKGNSQIVSQLLECKDIQVNGKLSFPLLHTACAKNNIEIVKLLLARDDIHVDEPNGQGYTALHLACDRTGAIEIVKLLLKRFIKQTVNWDQARLLFIGNIKNNEEWCNLAKLPVEMIYHIIGFCDDNRKSNIQALKRFICHKDMFGNPAFKWVKGDVKKELGHLLDPQAWRDDQTAQKTYHQLINILKEDEQKQSQENGKEEQE